MACFTPALLEQFLIWLVVVIAVIAIANLIIPWFMNQFGSPDGGLIMRTLQIFVWAVVVIAIIIFVFKLVACSGLLAIR